MFDDTHARQLRGYVRVRAAARDAVFLHFRHTRPDVMPSDVIAQRQAARFAPPRGQRRHCTARLTVTMVISADACTSNTNNIQCLYFSSNINFHQY